MSYTPTHWNNGDIITAAKMNKLEDGVAAKMDDYDLVIVGDWSDRETLSSYHIIKGNPLDCRDKVTAGDPLKGILLYNYSANGGIIQQVIFPMVTFVAPIGNDIIFNGVNKYNYNTTYAWTIMFSYDLNDGTLNRVDVSHITLGEAVGYDLIIEGEWTSGSSPILNRFDIVQGNPLECEDKIANHEPVRAVCVINNEWSYVPSGANIREMQTVLSLNFWHGPYHYFNFISCVNSSLSASGDFAFVGIEFSYDPSTGELTNVYGRTSASIH